MSDTSTTSHMPLEAASPFELRVNLGQNTSEVDVRSALASGDMGFLHSFTTGATVDGPGGTSRRVDDRLYVAVPLLPQPGHLDDDQRAAGDGRESGR